MDVIRGHDDAALDAAMARVLDAERSARGAVEDCARAAEALVADAQRQEKEIAARAAQRAAAVRSAMATRLAASLAKIDSAEGEIAPRPAITDADRERLAAAIERLAVELTGAAP